MYMAVYVDIVPSAQLSAPHYGHRNLSQGTFSDVFPASSTDMGLFLPSLYSLHVYQGKRLFQDIIGDALVSPLNSVIVFEGKIPISSCILRTRFPMRAQ